VNRAPSIRLDRKSPSAALIHGDNGPGAVVSDFAIKTAIADARGTGIGMVVVRNSNHNGSNAFYTTQAASLGLIGAAATNAPVSMAVWGSRGRALGTNPFSVAIPAQRHSALVVDMATSTVARGKIVEAAKRGESIPVGLALAPDGAPTTDARTAEAGAMLPFAGPKGSALALLVDIFCGVLSGASFGAHVQNLYTEFERPQDNGHFSAVVDPALFLPRAEFLTRIDAFIDLMQIAPIAYGFDAVLMPGQPELRHEATNRVTGIPLPPNVIADIAEVARDLGVTLPAGSAAPLA
jgi:LDH2 family malate/lactate/ureidoglycolate dehydrogenase